jgi:uncharacterized protein
VLSEREWKLESLLWLLLGVCVFFTTGQLVLRALENFGILRPAGERQLINIFVNALTLQGAAVVLVVFLLREQKLSWSKEFGFGSPRRGRAISLGLGAGVLIVPVAQLLQYFSISLMRWINLHPESQELVKNLQDSVAKGATSPDRFLEQMLFGISVIVIAPVAEELFFRGILYPTIKQMGRPQLALWASSLLFAISHNNGPSFLPFLALALLLVLVYEATDNLLAPILTHSVFNTANFIYLLYEQPINHFLQRFGFS